MGLAFEPVERFRRKQMGLEQSLGMGQLTRAHAVRFCPVERLGEPLEIRQFVAAFVRTTPVAAAILAAVAGGILPPGPEPHAGPRPGAHPQAWQAGQ